MDEIGELPPQAQVRLLHVLQNQVFERVGGTRPIKIDTRVISATHRDLQEMIVSKQFREDLWFRLNVFPIQIPPLRDRMEDIPALLNYFIEKKKKELRIDTDVVLAPGSLENLMAYHWPGNVRELINVIERAMIQHDNGCIVIKPLDAFNSNDVPSGKAGLRLKNPIDKAWNLDDAMRIHIERALKMCNGKISGPGGVAELLEVLPNTLRKRMDKLNISYRKK